MTATVKVCRKCHLEKPIGEFWITDAASGYRRSMCKECDKAAQRRRYAESSTFREKANANSRRQAKLKPRTTSASRRYMLKNKYRLTELQYEALLAEQNGRCALCGAQEVGSGQWSGGHFHVDHDHGDGHVRGLLCQQCNTQLGGYEALLTKVGETALLDYLTQPCPVPAAPPPVVVAPVYRHVAELPPIRPRRALGICAVDGCDRAEKEAGLCSMHYARRLRTGDVGQAEALVRGAKGEAHPKSKLTADDVREIRSSPERGVRLAERFGVTPTLISNIRQRKVWRHVA